MKKLYILLGLCLSISVLYAQNFNDEFLKASRDGNTQKQQQILSLWGKSENKDADFYIAGFNYYINESINEDMNKLDINSLGQAFDMIDEGIDKYPNRLDLRCGKIFALYKFAMWDDFTNEVIHAVDYSYIIDNKWIYPQQKADKDFFLDRVQQYQADLFDEIDLEILSKEDSLQILRIKKISESVLKYYPDNVAALNNQGAMYFQLNEDSKALEIFLKAENIAPKDDIVLLNILNIYAKNGDKENTTKYYNKIKENCDSQAVKQANGILELNR